MQTVTDKDLTITTRSNLSIDEDQTETTGGLFRKIVSEKYSALKTEIGRQVHDDGQMVIEEEMRESDEEFQKQKE